MGRQIKDDVKFGKYEWNWIQTWDPVVRWKHISQKYYTNMSLMLLRHNGVVDVKLVKETQRLLSIVSWFSESGHLLRNRSKTSHIFAGLGPSGSKSGLHIWAVNDKFRQSSLTCRAQIRRRSKMSWFHIKPKCNNWLREAMVLLQNGFIEIIHNICCIFSNVTNNYFS